MAYNFNNPTVLATASTLLGESIDAQSMNGRANSLHARFLKNNKKSSYANKVDYADAVMNYNNVLLGQGSEAAIRFDTLIQDQSIYQFFHDFYQTRF